jgi:hypothetical protein
MDKKNSYGQWMENEFCHVDFGDTRLDMRLLKVVNSFTRNPHAPINQACGSWRDAKGAYRLFANDKFDIKEVMDSHQFETYKRMKNENRIFAIQDTTYLDFDGHHKAEGLGGISKAYKKHKMGLIFHPVLAIGKNDVPIGILGSQCWARPLREESQQERTSRKYQSSIEEKESIKWINGLIESQENIPKNVSIVTIADRECDFFEFMNLSQTIKSPFVIRSRMNRKLITTKEDHEYLWEKVRNEKISAKLEIEVKGNGKRKKRKARVEVRYTEVDIMIRINLKYAPNRSNYANQDSLKVRVIEVFEKNPPKGIEPLHWILLTNEEINSKQDAIEKIIWYQKRWLIEEYFKILKTGCQVELCCLGNSDKLQKFITVKSIIALKIFSLTRIMRSAPNSSCDEILSKDEWMALSMRMNAGKISNSPPTIYQAGIWIAMLGGFMARKNDKYPGPIAIWKGWNILKEYSIIFRLMK